MNLSTAVVPGKSVLLYFGANSLAIYTLLIDLVMPACCVQIDVWQAGATSSA